MAFPLCLWVDMVLVPRIKGWKTKRNPNIYDASVSMTNQRNPCLVSILSLFPENTVEANVDSLPPQFCGLVNLDNRCRQGLTSGTVKTSYVAWGTQVSKQVAIRQFSR